MAAAYHPSLSGAAGGAVSRCDDLLAFLRALADGELLDADETAQMHDTVAVGEGLRYGLGLEELPFPGDVPFGHGGDIWGYHSLVSRFPGAGIGLVVVVNRDGADRNAVALALLEALGLP